MSPRAAMLLVVSLAASCTFERRSPEFACDTVADCSGGRVCTQGWCVDPLAADGSVADATVDGGMPDVEPGPDGEPPDAMICPPTCTRCEQGACVMECAGTGACPTLVVCPIGVPCQVLCSGDSSCALGVDCTGASSCDVQCTQTSACGAAIGCGNGVCRVSCSGQGACAGGVDCDSSCHCDVFCTGPGACTTPAMCPGPNQCISGAGCTSQPGPCHPC